MSGGAETSECFYIERPIGSQVSHSRFVIYKFVVTGVSNAYKVHIAVMRGGHRFKRLIEVCRYFSEGFYAIF